MTLYRASITAAVIFGSLAIAVSSATRLCGCCAQAGASHFKSRAGSSGSTHGVPLRMVVTTMIRVGPDRDAYRGDRSRFR